MKMEVHTVTVLTAVVLLNLVSSANVPLESTNTSAKCRRLRGYEYFYDHGTEHCEPCREICQYAEYTRTQKQCNEECPKYLTAMRCAKSEDLYYDEVLDICSPCSELCDNHQATGNTRVCRKECGAYLEKLTPKQVPSRHKQNYLKAVDGSDEEESHSAGLDLHPGWIAVISVGGLAVICFVIVVVILYWTCRQQQYGLAPQNEVVKQRPRQPVEETIQGSRDSQHFAIDAGSSGLPPTAFSDLRDDGIRDIITNHDIGNRDAVSGYDIV